MRNYIVGNPKPVIDIIDEEECARIYEVAANTQRIVKVEREVLTGPRLSQLNKCINDMKKKMYENMDLRMEAYFGRAWQSGVLTSVAREAVVNIIKDTKLMKTFASRVADLLPEVQPPNDVAKNKTVNYKL